MVGCNNKNPPMRYVIFAPIIQKHVDEIIGPRALARAPNDLKIPKTVPF